MTFRFDSAVYAAYRTTDAGLRAEVDGAATAAGARLATDDLGLVFAPLTPLANGALERVRRAIDHHAQFRHADARALDELIAAIRAREAANARDIEDADTVGTAGAAADSGGDPP